MRVSGEKRWSFPTRAPVRFAPTYWNGRIFATSDDGYLYCLKASDGALLWKKRGGPTAEMILGNGRMISRWPARGGVVIKDDILYYGAGIWPSDGIYLYALDPETGEKLWLNDTAGSIYMGQPHGGAYAKSGVASQGYLVASEERIFMPTGRSVPAAFDRGSGEFQYFALQANTKRGGAEAILSGECVINGGYAFLQDSGDLHSSVGAGPIAAVDGGIVGVVKGELTSFDWIDKTTVDRKGKSVEGRALKESYSLKLSKKGTCVIGAGDRVVVGLEDGVSVVASEKESWGQDVEGTVYGLAASDGPVVRQHGSGVYLLFWRGGRRVTWSSKVSRKKGPIRYMPSWRDRLSSRPRFVRGMRSIWGVEMGNWPWSWRGARNYLSMV